MSSSTRVNYENAEVETFLVIDPTNSAHLVGIWQQDRWNGPGAHGLMTGVSRDGGQTWTRNFAIFSRCSGGNPMNGADYDRASDPWITISPNGTIYESGLPFDSNSLDEAVVVNRSTDGGDTWSNPITLMFDNGGTVSLDKDSITADSHDSSFVYAAWDRCVFTDASQSVIVVCPTWFSRTTDGGASWEPARIIYNPPNGLATIGSEIVVLPNETLVDMFQQYDNTSASYFTIRSTDKGASWSQPTLIDAALDIGITDVKTGEAVRGGVANIAVDPVTGTLYFVWQDARFSGKLRDGIAFSTSTDGGLSWSPAVQVNQAPGVQAFAPQIAVSASGRIGITYYDFRKDTSDPNTLLTNYWQITSQDGGKTWQEIPLSASFDMRTAPTTGLGYMITDYEGLVPMGNSFLALFVATNSGNTSNRTDVFAASTAATGNTAANGHIEINSRPLTTGEQMQLRRRRPPSIAP
jgi:Neuraminidase (sialidase)